MPRHLALCHLKAVALRVLVLEASRGTEDALENSLAWRKLEANLKLEVEYQLPPKRTDGMRLDHFLQKILDANLPDVSNADPIASVVDLLRAQCRRIDCESCAAEANAAPCNGSPIQDPHIVAQAGHCIRPLKTVFDETAKLAATIYHRAAGLTGVGAELATELGRPLLLNDTLMTISGQVFWADVGDVRRSEVQLCIDAASIDRRGLSMLPYTLAHEIFCHVYQFALGDHRDGEPDQYCAFAEGWMDYVAALIVRGGPLRTEFTPWPEPEFGDIAITTHGLRREKFGGQPFPGAARVRIGAHAAERVHTLYENHQSGSGLGRSAWEDFVDLSCLLNASPDWTQLLRGTALPSLPRRLGSREASEVDRKLVDALLKWRHERDTNAAALDSVIAALAAQN